MQGLIQELRELSEKITLSNKRIRQIHQSHPIAQRLTSIPGVGPLAATAIVAKAGDPRLFKNGREFAAYLGLVPRQSSSGGKQNLLGISKRGDKYIRTMLVHGARVLVSFNERMNFDSPRKMDWIAQLKARRGFCKTTVAVANKNARTCWALMMKEESYKLAA